MGEPMSKGDTPRPLSVPQETYASEWDRIFGCHRLPDPSTSSSGQAHRYKAGVFESVTWETFTPGG